MTRLALRALLVALLAAVPSAEAAPPPPATPPPASPPRASAPRAPVAKPKARAPELPPSPAPELHLTIDAPSPVGVWTLHVENAGSVPLRVLADARLAAFDIAPPPSPEPDAAAAHHRKARPPRPVRCVLPADMRPRDYDDRALIVPPGGSYIEKLDPRLFCFGAREAAALVPGAQVIPHLVGSRETPAIEPIEEVEPKVASAVDWPGAPATIGPMPPSMAPKEPGGPQPLAISTPAFADVGLGWETEIPTTVRATSSQSVALLFRPETLAFDVTGPSGVGVTDPSPTVHCTWPGHPPAPIAEVYTHLAPKQEASITVLLSTLCPDDTLRRPGLYVVRAHLVTRDASGASVGVRTFTGEILAGSSTRVRVRGWSGPTPPPSGRPRLADEPTTSAR